MNTIYPILAISLPFIWYLLHLALIVDGPLGWRSGPNGPGEIRRIWVWILSVLFFFIAEYFLLRKLGAF